MADNLVRHSLSALLARIENEKTIVQQRKDENQQELTEILNQYYVFHDDYNKKMKQLIRR